MTGVQTCALPISFTQSDLAHIPPNTDRDEWLTRLWCAKEAHAKQSGKGLTSPKSLQVTAIQDETIHINNTPVQTLRHDNWIIAPT